MSHLPRLVSLVCRSPGRRSPDRRPLDRRARRARLAALLLGATALGSLALLGAAAPAAADCTNLGGQVVCNGRVSHTEVGRSVIFPQGPAARRSGHFLRETPGALPEVLPRDGAGAEAPGPRPLNRPDALTSPTKGRDFGAFEFPSGTGSALGSLPRD